MIGAGKERKLPKRECYCCTTIGLSIPQQRREKRLKTLGKVAQNLRKSMKEAVKLPKILETAIEMWVAPVGDFETTEVTWLGSHSSTVSDLSVCSSFPSTVFFFCCFYLVPKAY